MMVSKQLGKLCHIMNKLSKKRTTIPFTVKKLWAAEDDGRVEAVVGPYKLHDTSIRTLKGTKWLADEVSVLYRSQLISQ